MNTDGEYIAIAGNGQGGIRTAFASNPKECKNIAEYFCKNFEDLKDKKPVICSMLLTAVPKSKRKKRRTISIPIFKDSNLLIWRYGKEIAIEIGIDYDTLINELKDNKIIK